MTTIFEILRKRTSFRAFPRVCTKDYTIKDDETGKSFITKKETSVFVPFGVIQMNPKYFPDPEKFDPYRLSEENKQKIVSGSFVPFGIGPRMCIGSRYALLEAKLLTFYILSKFAFVKTAKTPRVLTIFLRKQRAQWKNLCCIEAKKIQAILIEKNKTFVVHPLCYKCGLRINHKPGAKRFFLQKCLKISLCHFLCYQTRLLKNFFYKIIARIFHLS